MAMMQAPATANKPKSAPMERYIRAAQAAGCPRDQITNLIRAGAVLQPKQLRASAAARLCDLPGGPTKIAFGGARGGGKSHWCMVQIATDDCQRRPGLKVLFLRKVLKYARESFNDLRRKGLGWLAHKYNENSGTIEFDNGSTIVVGHYAHEKDIDNYLGLEYDIIAIEESTTITASKKRNIYTCLRTSKPNWRPRAYETTNPGGVGHGEFKKQFIEPYRRNKETDTRFIPSTVDDNAYINKEYSSQLEQLTGWQLKAWRYGDWDVASGQYFSNWSRDTHVIKAHDIPSNWTVWGGLDYGFTHYTVAYLAAKDNDGNIYIIGEHAARKTLVEHHAEAIKGMVRRVLNDSYTGRAGEWDRVSVFVAGADVFGKRGAEVTVADQYAAHGINLTQANSDRISGATNMLNLLGDVEKGVAPKLRIFDTCPMLIECMPAMQHDPNRPEDVLKVDTDDDGVGGDDAYDAARYTIMAAEKVGGSFSFSYM
jgi:hypothetical protein